MLLLLSSMALEPVVSGGRFAGFVDYIALDDFFKPFPEELKDDDDVLIAWHVNVDNLQ